MEGRDPSWSNYVKNQGWYEFKDSIIGQNLKYGLI